MNKKLSKLVKSLNNETKTLVLGLLESPIKWDLINFYYSNPFSIHTARGLANIIGRRPQQVFEEAEALTAAGVLRRVCENGDTTSIYAYEPEPEIGSLIRMLVDLNEEGHTLMDELYQYVKDEKVG